MKGPKNQNDTLGIGLGNDTIGDFKGIMVGNTGGQNLNISNANNDTLNFYVTALKKEEN